MSVKEMLKDAKAKIGFPDARFSSKSSDLVGWYAAINATTKDGVKKITASINVAFNVP
jgi:hypothetical protein